MTARVTAETAFRHLAEGMSHAGSEAFFDRLTELLANILHVDHVLVARARALAEMGCDQAQGFLYGPPLPADDFAARWTDAMKGQPDH